MRTWEHTAPVRKNVEKRCYIQQNLKLLGNLIFREKNECIIPTFLHKVQAGLEIQLNFISLFIYVKWVIRLYVHLIRSNILKSFGCVALEIGLITL